MVSGLQDVSSLMGYTLFPCCSSLSSNPSHGSTGGADQTSMSFLILLDLYSTLIPCALTNAWAQFASSCSDARRDSTSSSRRRRGRLSSRRGSEEAQSLCSGCGSSPARRCTRFHFCPPIGHIRFMLRAICMERRGDYACYPSIIRVS